MEIILFLLTIFALIIFIRILLIIIANIFSLIKGIVNKINERLPANISAYGWRLTDKNNDLYKRADDWKLKKDGEKWIISHPQIPGLSTEPITKGYLNKIKIEKIIKEINLLKMQYQKYGIFN